MAPRKVSSFWRERIREITENEPRLGPARIARRLEEEAGNLKRNDYPSERTIGRIQREFRRQPEEERHGYREFRWPETLELGVLPWGASRAGLELLGYFQQQWAKRPLIGLVREFWHVSQAAWDAPFEERYFAAREVYQRKVFGRDNIAEWDATMRYWEQYLAYAPWRSDKARQAFEAMIKSDPLLEHAEFGPNIPIEVDVDRDPEAIDKFLGYGLSEKERQAFINRSGEALQGGEEGEE